MPDVSGRTLMMAIQAVDAQMTALQATIDEAGEDNDPSDAEDQLLGYEKAAEELRAAYEIACLSSSNLPAYSKLVKPVDE